MNKKNCANKYSEAKCVKTDLILFERFSYFVAIILKMKQTPKQNT